MEKRDDKNLSNVVIRKVQEMILSGELQEGDKLPPEREMTQRLGIGRPALREGLKSLEMLGLSSGATAWEILSSTRCRPVISSRFPCPLC